MNSEENRAALRACIADLKAAGFGDYADYKELLPSKPVAAVVGAEFVVDKLAYHVVNCRLGSSAEVVVEGIT